MLPAKDSSSLTSSQPGAVASAHWLLAQPNTSLAESVIRATRTETYFKKWDAFTRGVTEALDVPPETAPFLGATLGAGLDLLFDRGLDSGSMESFRTRPRLRRLADRIELWAVPARALQWTRPRASMTFEQATMATVALVTLGGLCGDDPDRWLPFWRDWLRRTLAAQVGSCGLDIDGIPPKSASDRLALGPYLSMSAMTDMGALGIVAAAGYSKRSSELIAPLRAFLPQISPVIRLAADMGFDPNEPVNCAVYLAAGELGISLRRARERIADDPNLIEQIENRLIAVTESALEELRDQSRRLEPTLVKVYEVVETAVLNEIELLRTRQRQLGWLRAS